MAWALRASSPANDGVGFSGSLTGSTHTLATGAAVVAGDLLVLGVWSFNTGTAGAGATQVPTYAVSDSINGSTGWAEVLTQTDLFGGTYGGRHSIWARPNSGAGTPTMTVTYTVAGASNQLSGGLVCAAFSGIATASPYDTGASATAVSTAPDSGAASPATGAASELAVGFYTDYGDNTTLSAGTINGVASTLAIKHDVDSNNWQGLLEYGDSGSSGGTPHALVSTSGSSHWGLLEAIFKLTGGGSTFTLSGSTTQAQTLTLPKQIRPTRSLTQTQALSSARGVSLTRAIAQTQAPSLRKAVALVRAITQSQALNLRQAVARTVSLGQPQALSILAQKVYLRTVSTTQAQAVSLTIAVRHTYASTVSAIQAQLVSVLSNFMPAPIAPPPVPVARPSTAPGSGTAVSNYLDWPTLVVNPNSVSSSSIAVNHDLQPPGISIISTDVPPPDGTAIGGP